jgi:hypothetical protein
MLISLQILLRDITDLERGLKRNGDYESLKKLRAIKKKVKILVVKEIQK